MRFLYMLLFAALFYVGFLVSWVVIVIQFVFALVTGDDSDKLRRFGSSLSQFLSQTLNYLTYNSEEKPFPIDEWPEPIPLRESNEDSSVDANINEDQITAQNTNSSSGESLSEELVPNQAVAPVEEAFAAAEDTKEPKEGEPVAVEEKRAAKIREEGKTNQENIEKDSQKTVRKKTAKTSEDKSKLSKPKTTRKKVVKDKSAENVSIDSPTQETLNEGSSDKNASLDQVSESTKDKA